MLNARPRLVARALVLTLFVALLAAGRVGALAANDGTEAGTVISNYAEATYDDGSGMGFRTVSPTVTVTVRSVAALTVTPDETEPSATVSPNERVTRLFRVCNTGNVPDLYTITRSEVSAPAALVSLHFDTDASGTLNDTDALIQLNQTLSPRVARASCVGVLAVVDTNASAPDSRITISLVARSNATDVLSGATEDTGTIINTVGSGARFSSPDDPALPPVKFVEGKAQLVAAHGQALGYSIAFRNSGDVTARNVRLRDDLPAGLDYVPNTLRLGTRALTDADDADEGSVQNRRLEIKLAQVAAGELVQVFFQARVTGSVPPGQGLVNTALVTADNTPAAGSTTATAVVNPFGLVYQGRSAGTPIRGARVALLADSTTGALVTLGGDGSEPNGSNSNPFASDGQGRFSFVLAPAQLGTAQTPARYFLNVTAEGYRSRMLEVTVTPDAATGLFTLTVRALDGQPVAQAGGFELVENAVSIEQLAAFALNVPMFENSTLDITKTVDRPSVEVGDVVSYRVELHNATAAAVNDAVIRDTLPQSFHYAQGTARVDVPPAAPRNVEPTTEAGGVLVFQLGTIPAGGRAFVTYRVRVGANAREGDQFNTATGTGTLPGGERLATPTARTPVRVRRGLFSSQQIILGRVFEDANLNGQFDKGERGLAGVRIYLNNGQSVITDSEGLYNFPSVNEGAQVLSLDPVTLAVGYRLVETNRRDEQSWTRLLRTPLGGGSLLRQNFALRAPDDAATGNTNATPNKSAFVAEANKRAPQTDQTTMKGSLFAGHSGEAKEVKAASPSSTNNATNGTNGHGTNGTNGTNSDVPSKSNDSSSLAAGTHELATNETLEPLAPGAVKILSPLPDETIAGAALEVEARTHGAWKIAVEVEGQRVAESKLGERRVDHKNNLATFRFVGLNVRPGPNKIKVTAVGPAGEAGQTAETIAFGRGPAKRIEIVTDKPEIAAGGRDRARVRVRAFDQWGRPAADGAVALEVTSGRLVRVEGKNFATEKSERGDENPDEPLSQQMLTLTGGEGVVDLIADGQPGETEIRATTGVIEAEKRLRVIPEVRPAILVGLAEVTVGSGAPELSTGDDKDVRSRIAFFYRGQVFGSNNLLTLAYDSNRALNRTAGRDRLFQLDPLDRAYPIFGDSSTRFEDAQSNSKLYARLDRGRSYFLFGDFESDSHDAGLASYTRKLTGAKLHLENSAGDFISVTGARPDTAFARDVFEGGSFTFARLTHGELLPGSETIAIEVRDRRNPDVIISREPLVRGVDYNLDPVTGEVFFLRPISTFDFQLNLVQVVATYEYAAAGMSSAVYTGRAFKTFDRLGLKLGLSFVNQRQDEFGSFIVGGLDVEKSLPRRGRLSVQWATSHGRALVGGNLFGLADDDARHDGNAYRAELEQPLPFREATLRASFVRADEGFLNPFGQTVTPGSQRAEGSLEMKVTRSSMLRFALTDERNHTSNVSNSRQTGSLMWTQTFGEKLRTTFGYDFRRFRDELGGTGTDSNLVTVGAEWQATDKLNVSVKREQNLTDADPTYPNQTTLAAKYQWNQFTNIFFTQRLASAPIVPISDAAATGFASVASQRETAIGVETKLGRYANLVSRYQLENGINGTDSFAVIGLANRFGLTKELSLDLGYERGFHLAGNGESFNSGHFGFLWNPTEDFRANARYELRDRGGLGTILSFGAAGRLGDGFTSLGRFQLSRVRFGGRDTTGLNATAALAWRPLESDRAGLLFSYTRRDLRQGAFENTPETRDRADVLSSDGYYQPTRDTELYGRFALKFGDTSSQELARVSTLTYMTQGRFVYHFGRYFDAAAEARLLAQPSSGTRRNSFGAELGYWVMPDLRVGGGYNWTGGVEPLNGSTLNHRRGFYFTISSKLSNLFDLFGTSRASEANASGDDAQGTGGKKKDDEEDEEE